MRQRAIKLLMEDPNISEIPELFAGDRRRLASATDVVFLGPRRMIFAHLAGQTIHLLRRRPFSRRWRIADSTIATANGQATLVDLLTWHAPTRRLAVSNCRAPSATVYRVGRRLEWEREIAIVEPKPGFTHGVEWHPDGRHLVIVNSGGSCAVRVYDVETGEETYRFTEDGWRPKDAAFLDREFLVVPMCSGSPTRDPGPGYSTRVGMYRLDIEAGTHELCASVDVVGAHTDGVFIHDSQAFVADQTNDLVKVYDVGPGHIAHSYDIGGVDFPHGIAADRERVAATSYGDSSLNLFARGTMAFEPADVYRPRSSRRAAARWEREWAELSADNDGEEALAAG